MPTIGQRSTHDCPDCGLPMYWSEAAERNQPRAAATAGVFPAVEHTDAYRCANGHSSQQCPLCNSYDTAGWSDTENGPHYHVICGNCGNDSIVNK